jgi:TRAP-type C4-dicarboxylate transport system substrate-binding protein
MPFIWRDSEHQMRVLDGEVGRIIDEKARELGLEIFGYFDAGTRNITTKKGPIRSPADLKGLKIRVMDAPLMVATINALGASATPLNQGEVYTALHMGVIDGWENNPMTVATTRMYETGCTHFAWTHHFSIPDVFVAGEPFLKKLTSQQRAWVEQAARETILEQRRMWKQSEQDALEQMRAAGMTFTDVQTGPYQDRVRALYEQYEQRYGDEFASLIDRIQGG